MNYDVLDESEAVLREYLEEVVDVASEQASKKPRHKIRKQDDKK